jgi:hypothetical protein
MHIFANTLVNAHSNAACVEKHLELVILIINTCGSTKARNRTRVNIAEKHFVDQMDLKFISEFILVKNLMPVMYVVVASHRSRI